MALTSVQTEVGIIKQLFSEFIGSSVISDNLHVLRYENLIADDIDNSNQLRQYIENTQFCDEDIPKLIFIRDFMMNLLPIVASENMQYYRNSLKRTQ